MAFIFWRRMSDVERDPALWRRSRREAFFCRADSLPSGCLTAFPQGRERELHSTVGDFMTKHCMKEILGGVIPLHMSLSDFCNLTEKELKTDLGIENPEQIKRILTIIQLAKELERESEHSDAIQRNMLRTCICRGKFISWTVFIYQKSDLKAKQCIGDLFDSWNAVHQMASEEQTSVSSELPSHQKHRDIFRY
ncbi:uncharacterized protein LOC143249274 isoform X1 [Tachypleus tridentatus]|uniref:uncharacterized protein LOC143249274 isoform X1 n=1 Tax=Tachypleus tridentatus TaxID=6853 RepID=UPI003FD3A074